MVASVNTKSLYEFISLDKRVERCLSNKEIYLVMVKGFVPKVEMNIGQMCYSARSNIAGFIFNFF